MKHRQDSGFTLIELLIVIVILGILAGVVVFSVNGIRDTAAENACKTEKRTVQTAVEAYYAENGANPSAMTQLTDPATGYLDAVPQYFELKSTVPGELNPLQPGVCT